MEIAARNPLIFEDWQISFSLESLSYSTMTYELNKAIELADSQVTVQTVEVSPLSLVIQFDDNTLFPDEGEPTLADGSLFMNEGELIMSNGEAISFSGSRVFDEQSWSYTTAWLYYLDYKTYEGILDVSQIASICIGRREFTPRGGNV